MANISKGELFIGTILDYFIGNYIFSLNTKSWSDSICSVYLKHIQQ